MPRPPTHQGPFSYGPLLLTGFGYSPSAFGLREPDLARPRLIM
jgi:hypothetical protein